MKKIIKIVIVLIAFNLLGTSLSHADIGKDLDKYFKDLGYASNTTNPAAFHGQQAGYYTGGNISMRSKVRDVQIVQVSLPSYRSGCGGIDIFGGSISILDREEIKKTLKSVLNNAVNYATTLTLETVSPMILKNSLYWKDFIDRMNQSSLNSCELAENLVGSAWPKMRSSQQRICQDIGTSNHNIFSSWAEARQGCGVGNDMEKTTNLAKKDSRYADMILDEGNITWKAIQKHAFLKNDVQLAELFMSLSGTVILTKDKDGNIHKLPYPALANQGDLINALLIGHKTDIYICDETQQCLHPTKQTITIKPEHAFKFKVATILSKISEHIQKDTELNDDEKSLIASTSIPIMQMITVTSAYLKEGSLPNTAAYAEVISTDILYQYLQESLGIVKASLSALPLSEDIIKTLEKNIEASIFALRSKQTQLSKQIEVTTQLITQTQSIERMLIGQFSTELASTISWAKDLK